MTNISKRQLAEFLERTWVTSRGLYVQKENGIVSVTMKIPIIEVGTNDERQILLDVEVLPLTHPSCVLK